MIYVFFGSDEYSIQAAISDLKKSLCKTSVTESNIMQLSGTKLHAEELTTAVHTLPFFDTQRMVIVRGLLSRFDAKEKQVSVKKKSKSADDERPQYQVFADIINSAPESTQVILSDGEIPKTNPLLKVLSPSADIRMFYPLKGIQLENWTRKRVSSSGGKIGEAALKMLVKQVGSDLWVMTGEIEKLVLYASGRLIEVDDVKKLVGLSSETSIFTLVDAIIERKLNLAQQSLSALLDAGAAPSYVLVMLARQLRLLVRAKELKNERRPEATIQSMLGLGDYPFRKTMEQVSKYTMERLTNFYHMLLDTDLSIKTGKYNDELAITLLVAEVCSQK